MRCGRFRILREVYSKPLRKVVVVVR